MPQPQSLKSQWLTWVLTSSILPALPFLFFGGKALDKAESFVLILVAMLAQLVASIFLARGIAMRRQLGIGGVIGLSVVFMMGSVAIGSAVFFVACLSTFNAQGWH